MTDVLNISDARADQIIKTFQHDKIDCEDNYELLLKTIAKYDLIDTPYTEAIFVGWMIARDYTKNNDPISGFLEKLFGGNS